MKSITTTTVLLVSSIFSCYSQEFNGFGEIRLGMEESSCVSKMQSTGKENYLVVTDKSLKKAKKDWMDHLLSRDMPPRLYKLEIKYDLLEWPTLISKNNASQLSEKGAPVSIYYLTTYQVGDLKLRDIYLTFKENKLHCIEMGASRDLLDAAVEKYPPSDRYDTAYKVPCVFVTSGVKEDKDAFISIVKWRYPAAEVSYNAAIQYTEKCKTSLVSDFVFRTAEFSRFLSEQQISELNQVKKAEADKKKSIKDAL